MLDGLSGKAFQNIAMLVRDERLRRPRGPALKTYQ
jgi:hypothetical protein